MVSNNSWRKLAWRQMYYVCLVLTKLYKASKSAQMSSLDLSVILNLHIEVSREYMCVCLLNFVCYYSCLNCNQATWDHAMN